MYDFDAHYNGYELNLADYSQRDLTETMREIDERYRLYTEYPEVWSDEVEFH